MTASPNPIQIRDFQIGNGPLVLIAGPCLAESLDLCQQVAGTMKELCADLGIPYIFKASFDKANRTSSSSIRGHGITAGLEMIQSIGDQFNLPTTTDIHDSEQAPIAAQVVDMLQVPAFLCRQTDILESCAFTGKPVNVKKGQFLAPWDTKNIVDKLRSFPATGIMLTDRGTSFGYNTLVVDMPGLEIMRSNDVPVCFDATHSAQRPGGLGTSTAGNRESIPAMARAAAAVGIDCLFLEVHPDPTNAASDSATQWPLNRARELLEQVLAIDHARRNSS